ncbi:hypothetical protein AK830_g4719 [Neonectria ditissima]|uniref:Zn(2)-C6 fungal-type domain-containing protein n=1 Tax=Neonectria ditissima TaxID=78410 RepID=A0A0P7BFK6_9HYPO|nr:hypothetical protein AK830_g4719 [Neonectria ditissima]
MTPPARSLVCLRCADIKQACDGGQPCSRCRRLRLPCHPKSLDAVSRRLELAAGLPLDDFTPRAVIRRVQTGCLTCKKRKKKCDEAKPRCADCRRLCLDCAWPRARQSRDSPGYRRRSSAETDGGLAVAGTEGIQAQAAVFPEVSEMDFASSFDAVSWNLPTAQQAWMDDVLGALSPFSNSPSASIASESLSLYTPSLVPDLQSPDDRALLNHYTTIVASVLSKLSDKKSVNPYLSHLVPAAMENELVLHCLLALSANHWHKLQPRLGSRRHFHQSKATQLLASLLPDVDKSSVGVALMSCLLLCMADLFDGKSSGWKLHLEGAKRLVATLRHERSGDITGHYRFLTKLSKFLDSAATTSTCRPPLIDETGEGSALDISAATPDDDDRAVYGIPKELFHLVDRVNHLADKRSTRVDPSSEKLFRLEAAEVEHQLERWSFEYGGLSQAVSSLSPANDDVLHATTAYEWALRLRLHQIIEGYTLTDPNVTQAVDCILDSVQKIRYGSPLEGCLVFPLVMAGGACSQLEHRVIVHDRLMVMERTCGFGYIYQARDLVEKVWNRRDRTEGTGARVNWARIRFEEMSGLAVF